MTRVFPDIPPITWRLGQVLITALLIALLWRAADGPEILRILSNAQPLWLLAAVVTLICQTILSALRWKITAAQLGQDLGFSEAIKEYFMSQVVNQAVPGAIVGDAARAVRTRAQAGIAVATQAVVFERLAGQCAMFITMAGAFLVTYLWQGGLDWPRHAAAPIGTAVAIGTAVILALVGLQWVPAFVQSSRYNWLRPFYKALLSKQVIGSQIALGLAITFCNLAAFWLCALAVGTALPFAGVVAIVPVVLFSMLIPFTVSGWGIREGAAAALLPLAGIAPSAAVAASVMFGCAILLAVLPGFIAVVLK